MLYVARDCFVGTVCWVGYVFLLGDVLCVCLWAAFFKIKHVKGDKTLNLRANILKFGDILQM